MTDSPELAAIRARIKAGWPTDNKVYADRSTLLRMLDEARANASAHAWRADAAILERDAARADYQRLATKLNDEAKAEKEHCKDCCCARSWRALGIDTYTGRSIPEHITALREAVAAWIETRRRVLSKSGITHGHAVADLYILEADVAAALSSPAPPSDEETPS